MYQKFMNKKFFHPGSLKNLQRKWETDKKEDERKKYELELSSKYQKEQDMINNRLLYISDDDKLKQGLSFMYEMPMTLNHHRSNQLESQKKENSTNNEIKIPNAKELSDSEEEKNIDNNEYLNSKSQNEFDIEVERLKSSDPLFLARGLYSERGLVFSRKIVTTMFDPSACNFNSEMSGRDIKSENEKFLIDPSDGEDYIEDQQSKNIDISLFSDKDYLKSLNYNEKKRLLRRLEKMERQKSSPRSQLHKKQRNDHIICRKKEELDSNYNSYSKVYKECDRHQHSDEDKKSSVSDKKNHRHKHRHIRKTRKSSTEVSKHSEKHYTRHHKKW